MGKIRHERKKFHIPGQTSIVNPITNTMEETVKTEPLISHLDVDIAALTRELADNDPETRSSITSKTLKGLNLKKKDKQKLRHELWLKKVDVIKMARNEESARQRRIQTPITGDLKPLEDTLPTVQLLLRDNRVAATTAIHSDKNKKDNVSTDVRLKKESVRQKAMMSDIALFSQIVQHPSFKSNPVATISEHLTNRQKLEDNL